MKKRVHIRREIQYNYCIVFSNSMRILSILLTFFQNSKTNELFADKLITESEN